MADQSRNPFSLAGQLGLITGGGTGIGLGIAQAYIGQGAKVVITGRREELLVDVRRVGADHGTAVQDGNLALRDLLGHAVPGELAGDEDP